MQTLALQLLASERTGVAAPEREIDLAVRACGKLGVPLMKLSGSAGFSSLLSRAVALAKRKAPALAGLGVEADGSLAGVNEIQKGSESAEAAQHAGVILVAELLGLLVTLIGEALTLRLVRDAWPQACPETVTRTAEEMP